MKNKSKKQTERLQLCLVADIETLNNQNTINYEQRTKLK